MLTRFEWRCLGLVLVAGLTGPGCLAPSAGGMATGGGSGSQTSGGSTGSSTGMSPCLTVSPSSLDFGYLPVGASSTKPVVLSDRCAAALPDIAAVVYGVDSSLFTIAGAPSTLGAGASATVDITYAPLALETRSAASVSFTATDGETATLDLFGEPVGSALRPSPDPIEFGFVQVGAKAIGCTALTNYSSATVEVTGVVGFADGGTFGVSQVDDSMPSKPAPIPVSIAGGGSAEVCFSFTPPIAQDYSGQATVTTNDPSIANPVVQLSGWGGGPQIWCAPTSIDYGQTLDHSVTNIPILCTNTGTAIPGENLTVTLQIVGPGADAWSASIASQGGQSDAGLDGLEPGQSFEIDVTFTPPDAGAADATLMIEISTGLEGSPDQETRITLEGSGAGLDVPPCQFVVFPPSLGFANVQVGQTSPPLSFEIQNVGTDICKVQGLAIKDDDTGSFHLVSTSINPDGAGQFSIPAPATGVTSSMTVTLDFAPSSQGGTFSGEAAFSISDPSDPNQVVQLSGASESTCLAVAPTSLNFGDAGLGDAGQFLPTAAQFFSVTNQCENTARLESITLESGPGDLTPQYSATTGPTLPALISPGSPVSYGISCAPTTPGPHPAQLVISDGTVDTLLPLTCSGP